MIQLRISKDKKNNFTFLLSIFYVIKSKLKDKVNERTININDSTISAHIPIIYLWFLMNNDTESS